MTDEKQSKSKNKKILIGCLTPVLILGAMVALGTVLQKTNADFIDAVGVCDTDYPDGEWPKKDTFNVTSFLKKDDGVWTFNYNAEVPYKFARPEKFADTDILFCLDPVKTEVVEKCAFGTAEKVVALYERRQQTQNVRLIDFKKKTTVARVTIRGGEPEPCPSSVGGGGGVGVKVMGIPVANIGGSSGGEAEDKVLTGADINKDIFKQMYPQLVSK